MPEEPIEPSRNYQHAVSDTLFLLKKITGRLEPEEYPTFRAWLIESGNQMFPDPTPPQDSNIDENDKLG